MKPFTLRSILETTRPISEHESYIAIGSSTIHDLIVVDKKTYQIRYKMDYDHEGRSSLQYSPNKYELAGIWDKLEALCQSGEIHDIIHGVDSHPNPVRLFCIKKLRIVEKWAHPDFAEYPYSTLDGDKIYENSHFNTREEAEIKLLGAIVFEKEWCFKNISEKNAEIHRLNLRLDQLNQVLAANPHWEDLATKFEETPS